MLALATEIPLDNTPVPWKRDPEAHTPAWLDKSLALAILGFVLPVINRRFGLGLDAEEVFAALSPLIGFIAMSKWKQTAITKARVYAEAQAKAEIVNLQDAIAQLRTRSP